MEVARNDENARLQQVRARKCCHHATETMQRMEPLPLKISLLGLENLHHKTNLSIEDCHVWGLENGTQKPWAYRDIILELMRLEREKGGFEGVKGSFRSLRRRSKKVAGDDAPGFSVPANCKELDAILDRSRRRSDPQRECDPETCPTGSMPGSSHLALQLRETSFSISSTDTPRQDRSSQTSKMSITWTPTPPGSPIWIEIPTPDTITNLKTFYSSLFPQWHFRDPSNEPLAHEVAHFSFGEGDQSACLPVTSSFLASSVAERTITQVSLVVSSKPPTHVHRRRGRRNRWGLA